MEFHIENTEVYGLEKCIIASGNAMRVKMDDNSKEPSEKDFKRAHNLGTTDLGEGHDQFLSGINVVFDLYFPLYVWKEAQRYRFLYFVTSQSTMHRLAKFDAKSQCVSDTDPVILERYQLLLDEYNKINKEYLESKTQNDEVSIDLHSRWRTLVASLPSGFVLGATMSCSYRQLKTIYTQRKNHKLKEWREFCTWCESLPKFKELCIKED